MASKEKVRVVEFKSGDIVRFKDHENKEEWVSWWGDLFLVIEMERIENEFTYYKLKPLRYPSGSDRILSLTWLEIDPFLNEVYKCKK